MKTDEGQEILQKVNRQGDQLARIERNLERLNHLITGGDNPSEGLLLRFDRVEQAAKRAAVWTRAAIGATVTSLFTFIALLIKSLK